MAYDVDHHGHGDGDKRYIDPEALGNHAPLAATITIRPGPAETMRRALLHEMAHVAFLEVAMATRREMTSAQTLAHQAELAATLNDDAKAHGMGWQREMWRLALDYGETWAVQHIVDNNPSVIDVLVAAFTRLPSSSLPAPTNDEEVYCRLIENRDCRDRLRAAYLSARPAVAGGHSARSAKPVGRLAAPADALR